MLNKTEVFDEQEGIYIEDDWCIMTDGGDDGSNEGEGDGGGDGANDGDGGNEGDGNNTGDSGDGSSDQNGGEQTVPLAALQSVRDENKELRQQVTNVALQLQAMQNQTPQNSDAETAKNGGGLFEGLEDDDIVTVANMKTAMNGMNNSSNANLLTLQFQMSHPDYETVVNKHLPNVLKSDPSLAMAIKSSSDPVRLAYTLGKLDPTFAKGNASNDAQRILDNNKKPSSPSGGQGANKGFVNKIMNMSKKDLEKEIARVKATA